MFSLTVIQAYTAEATLLSESLFDVWADKFLTSNVKINEVHRVQEYVKSKNGMYDPEADVC